MKTGEAWSVHASTILVAVTGGAYAWARYVAEPIDEFAIHHPLQPLFQHAHVLVAPFLVFALGLVWREHVWKHLVRGVSSRRRSGLVLFATLLPMVASGYLLQVTVDPFWNGVWVWTHGLSSVVWVVGWLAHWAARLAVRRAQPGRGVAGPRPDLVAAPPDVARGA